jgi:hypothetical protein
MQLVLGLWSKATGLLRQVTTGLFSKIHSFQHIKNRALAKIHTILHAENRPLLKTNALCLAETYPLAKTDTFRGAEPHPLAKTYTFWGAETHRLAKTGPFPHLTKSNIEYMFCLFIGASHRKVAFVLNLTISSIKHPGAYS